MRFWYLKPPSMSQNLVNLPFKHSKGLEIGIEILRLKDLYIRQQSLDHPITDPHRLGFYMLLYVTAGEGNHTIDFQSFSISPHTLAIVSKHQVNQFGRQSVLEGFLVLITEEFLQRALFDLEGTVTSLLFEPITTQALLLKEAKSVYPHIKRLDEEYRSGNHDAQHIPILTRELGILLLKAERLRCQQLPQSVQNAETSVRLIAFRDLLEVYFKKHWTAQKYADTLGFSKRTLGSITRKHLNRSPKEVIDQRLLLEIKRLLAHTDQSIKEIAFELGFEDPSNVNKFFKRMSGSTPSSFRLNLKITP